MTKVFPNTASELPKADFDRQVAITLTVWKKSLLFNCNGFTVFDAKGNLTFRVDNYMASNKGEILLMDGAGEPLLTIRRKKLTLWDHWLIFNGEETANPRLSVKKNVNILNSTSLAHVTAGFGASPKHVIYHVEGSYTQRCCAVYDDKKRRVAEIKRKEAVGGGVFGPDVFRLVVEPGFDPAVAMSLVILLEQMFGSPRRFGTHA